MKMFFTVCVFFTAAVFFLDFPICRTGNRAFTAVSQNILTFFRELLQGIEISAWKASGTLQGFQQDTLQQVYPKTSLWPIHSGRGGLCLLQGTVFQVIQDKQKRTSGIFKYTIPVLAQRTSVLFTRYGEMTVVLIPLNFKAGVKKIETHQGIAR